MAKRRGVPRRLRWLLPVLTTALLVPTAVQAQVDGGTGTDGGTVLDGGFGGGDGGVPELCVALAFGPDGGVIPAPPPPTTMPWTDPTLPPEERAQLILSQMTLAEKVAMATGDPCGLYGFYNAPIPRLGIPPLLMTDGPSGVRVANPNTNEGEATYLPAPIALGASWDLGLAQQYGNVLGEEAFQLGHNVMLAPVVDIVRVPLWGRGFETFGEDPFHVSQFGTTVANAIQQGRPVISAVKHYVAYNQEANRFNINVDISERALREIYLPPFEAAVQQAVVGGVMCAFNAVNGEYLCQNNRLLDQILKQEYNFSGFVLSDFGAVQSTVPSALAGLDQEQPGGTWYGRDLLVAVQSGTLEEQVVNDMVLRILTTMLERGLFENTPTITGIPEQDHGEIARSIAEQSMVLLKNSNNLLPLDASQLQSVALIGPAANSLIQGGGSARVRPTYGVTSVEGFRNQLPSGVEVRFAEGVSPITAPGALLPGPSPVAASALTPPGEPPTVSGVLAQYWLNTSFEGDPVVSRVEPYPAVSTGFVNFGGFNASTLPGLPGAFNAGPFSARWTGTLRPPTTGEYTFALTNRATAILYLNGMEVLRNDSDVDISTETVMLQLSADETYDIRVDYIADELPAAVDLGADMVLGWIPPEGTVPQSIQDAADVAAAADVAVVVVRAYETEARDRPSLSLPADQDQLIREVAQANPNTVVVIMSALPVTMPWLDQVPAVVHAWYPGQEQGNAIARVLLGEVNPSGHLPVTFPKDFSQTPFAGSPLLYPGTAALDGGVGGEDGGTGGGQFSVVEYQEGVLVGYRWYDERNIEPLFPFGYGLSYTSFEFSDLEVTQPVEGTDGGGSAAQVSFTITNTGDRPGAQVGQVYVGELTRVIESPPRQLAGWAKVHLEPGASQRVTVDIPARALQYWSPTEETWVVGEGPIPVFVGPSSRDLPLTGEIQVGEDIAGVPLDPNEPTGCGCGAQSGSAAGVVALVVLGLMFVRRRRGDEPGAPNA